MCPEGELCCPGGPIGQTLCMAPLPPESPYTIPCGSCIPDPLGGVTYICSSCPNGYAPLSTTNPNECFCYRSC
jgi:hypothetical protein